MHITYTLGEVRILGTVLLWVYSGTFLPISIEIASYFTDMEKKKSWQVFFPRHAMYFGDTQCVYSVHYREA